jgi:hypothetical protein
LTNRLFAMDDLRESMQMEKLRALKPVEVQSDYASRKQLKPGLGSLKQDPKTLGKDIQEEVDERVRNNMASEGEHCDLWMQQVQQAAALQKSQSDYVPTESTTPLEVYVTVHLKAKTLKRLLTKVGVLADLCLQRGYQESGNFNVYVDAKGHVKGDFELKLAPEQMVARRGAKGLATDGADGGLPGGGWAMNAMNAAPGRLPSLIPIEANSVKRNKVSEPTKQKKLLQDGSVYQGALKDGRPHGLGTVVYADTDPKQRVRFAGELGLGYKV